MDEALGRELVLGNRVIHEASGFTGEVRKTYAWGVEVWVPALGNSREIWSWPMITVRTPRIIKRYPRPFRWPREIPTEQCHCKIGRMEVEGENQVRCTRCKKLVGNEAFPARFRRASQFLRKAYQKPFKRIRLTQGRIALVDAEDYDWLRKWKWYFDGRYAVRSETIARGKQRTVWMHREIAKTPEGTETDHWNEVKLDNRKQNLRTAGKPQNMSNRGKQRNNTSGYKGVRYFCGGWNAQIGVRGRKINLGIFPTREEAAREYDKAAIKHHGEFAKTNFRVGTKGVERQSKVYSSPRVERPRRRKTPRVRPKRKTSHRVGVRPSRRGKAATRYGKSKRPRNKGQRRHRSSLPKARKGRPPSLSTPQAGKTKAE